MDETEDARELVAEQALPFRILSARDIPVLADYRLVHPGGGPGGEDIAIPAQLLVGQDGRVLWRHVAGRITDRASPGDTLAAIDEFFPSRAPAR